MYKRGKTQPWAREEWVKTSQRVSSKNKISNDSFLPSCAVIFATTRMLTAFALQKSRMIQQVREFKSCSSYELIGSISGPSHMRRFLRSVRHRRRPISPKGVELGASIAVVEDGRPSPCRLGFWPRCLR